MSEPQSGELDFDKALFEQPAAGDLTCQVCKQPLADGYFSLNGHSICARCLELVRAGQKSSFFKALLLGSAAGAVGAAVYYGIRELTGYDLALITIGLGILVGVAVRRGAGGSQSVMYRLMAVGLAWISMCVTYVPMVAGSMAGDQQAGGAALYVVAAVFSIAVPFLLVAEMEILGVLIFGFGLWEAWRLSAAPPFVVQGPFTLTAPAQAPAADASAEAAPPAP